MNDLGGQVVRVGLLAVATTVGGSWTVGCHHESMCQRLSTQQGVSKENAALFKEVAPSWGADVDVCHQGAYTIITPARGEEAAIFVAQGKHGVLVKDPSGVSLFQGGKPLITVSDTNQDGRYDVLSYDGVDGRTGESVTVVDVGIDGQADMKFSLSAQGIKTTWLWVQNGWYEQAARAGKSGVLVNGAFKSVQTINGQRILEKP